MTFWGTLIGFFVGLGLGYAVGQSLQNVDAHLLPVAVVAIVTAFFLPMAIGVFTDILRWQRREIRALWERLLDEEAARSRLEERISRKVGNLG